MDIDSKIEVYTLTDDNFERLVGNGTNGTWFIHFYAPVKYFTVSDSVVVLIMSKNPFDVERPGTVLFAPDFVWRSGCYV